MKKFVGIMFMFVVLASAGFAQEEVAAEAVAESESAGVEEAIAPTDTVEKPEPKASPQPQTRFQPFDMLLGLSSGAGINMGGDPFSQKKGFFIMNADLGVSYDFYVFSWLSAGSGLFLHLHASEVLKEDIDKNSYFSFIDGLWVPLCITLPLMAHINVPHAEWLYVGAGLNVNIPLFNLMETVSLPDSPSNAVFLSVPIEVGIDFATARSPKRFVLRIMPNMLESGTLLSFGFMYQSSSRIFHKQ
jgi:hypothetical protein